MKPWPVLLHINYFEQGPSLREACRIAGELGADGIEFRQLPAGYQSGWRDYLDEVSRALDAYPLREVSFGGPGADLMVEDDAARESGVEDMAEFYRLARNRFPVRIFNVFTGRLLNPDRTLNPVDYWHHGSVIATERQWSQAVEGVRRLARIAEEDGFDLAFETHGFYLHDTIEAAVSLARQSGSPRVGVLWDQANLMIFKNALPMVEAIRTLGTYLRYVHLKNHLFPPAEALRFCGLKDGIINVREQLRLLQDAAYEGPICLESPRDGDRLAFARDDLAYLSALQGDLGRI